MDRWRLDRSLQMCTSCILLDGQARALLELMSSHALVWWLRCAHAQRLATHFRRNDGNSLSHVVTQETRQHAVTAVATFFEGKSCQLIRFDDDEIHGIVLWRNIIKSWS